MHRPADNHWESFTWCLSLAVFNDDLSFPENASFYAGCHAESVFQPPWVQSQARSRSHGLLSKEESWQPTGFSQDRWRAPGSLMVTHLDRHPSCQPLTG